MNGRIPGLPFPIGSQVTHYYYEDPMTVVKSGSYSTSVVTSEDIHISFATSDLSAFTGE